MPQVGSGSKKKSLVEQDTVRESEKQFEQVTPETKSEQPSVPETGMEQEGTVAASRETEGVQDEIVSFQTPKASVSEGVAVAPIVKDKLDEDIEDILEEDLKDVVLAMSAEKQQEFIAKGEETAFKVRGLLEATKINTKKIFSLIRTWLRIIPGVNRFFLEQEAKIKTDKILLANKSLREQDQNEL